MMLKIEKLILILCIAFYAIPGKSQSLSISVEPGRYQIDDQHMMIVARIDSIENYSLLSQYQDVKIILGADEYSFSSIPGLLEYSSSYIIYKGSENYTLYFTQLPLISIICNSPIVNDPKVVANFTYSDDEITFSSEIGIELRGGVSLKFPKKTFDLEFWTDSTGNTNRQVRFGALRLDDDWILDALYNEPLRIRSYLAHNLWLEIHQPHYLNIKPSAKAGAEVIFVEVFLNGSYNGVYILSEQIDKKQLQIVDYDGTTRGELYKAVSWGGACTFDNLPSYSNTRLWGGFEYKYPEESQTSDWSNLYDFIDFVINSSNSDFESDIWNRFNKENCMDYYIYLNLIRAGDNRGKNIYLGKADVGQAYFNTPWDLDACFGTNWKGENDPRTENILTNGLFRRANNLNAGEFKTDMGNRWHAYRDNILSTESLVDYFNKAYNYLVNNRVYARESIVYPNYSFSAGSYSYMVNWLQDRLTFLDTYFIETEDPHSYTESLSQQALFYPNPAVDHIRIQSENDIIDPVYTIFDLTGKLVLQGRFNANEQIDLSGLSSGIYFIKLDRSTFKLIVQ